MMVEAKGNRRMMNRRILLNGLAAGGLCAGLPLGAASQANQKKVKARKKLIIESTALGFFDDHFLPQKAGQLGSSRLLKLLEGFYGDLTVFHKISQTEIGHGHKRYRGLLTCNRNQTNGPYISLDQFIAGHLQQDARFKTVNFGDPPLVWSRNSRSVNSLFESDPEHLYNKLFTKESSDKILETKIKSLQVLQSRLSLSHSTPADYKRAIKELENEIAVDLKWSQRPITKVDFDTSLHLSDAHDRGYTRPFEQSLQLARLAAEHKRGQIFVVSPPFVDKTSMFKVNSSYHALGHQARQDKQSYEEILRLESLLFEDFQKFLSSIKASGQMDETIILFLGGFNDAGAHQRKHIPCILAGGGFKHQGIVDCMKGDKPTYTLSELYVSIMHQMGLDLNEFAGFKGDLDKIIL